MKHKQDFFIFQDYDQFGYGFIRKQELEYVIYSDLNLKDDGTFQFFMNSVKDDRSGDVSLRKMKEGIEKERDARMLQDDLIDLVKEQHMDVDKIFRNFDFNSKAAMELKEFERLVRTLQPNVASPVVEVLFVKFDSNNDRSITLKEFRSKIFGQQAEVIDNQDQKVLLVQHFIWDLDELIEAAKTTLDNLFKPYEH